MAMNKQIMQIAARIREMREILDIDPAELAKELGISTEEYLKYETGEDDIPIGVLYSTAGIFGIDPTELLTGEKPRMVDYTIVRAGQGTDIERCPGYSFRSLATNFIHRDMEPMIVEVSASDKPADLIAHGGQEFNMVLEGSIAVIIKNHEFVLNEGDSIYFDPRVPHGQKAISENAKFLTVINEWGLER